MAEPTRHLDQELTSYLDGELDAAALERVEAHLRACPDCGELLDELRAVVAGARSLEHRVPETDLWPGIERRLGANASAVPIVALPAARRRAAARRFSFSLPQLAAAAAAIAVVSGAFVWWAERGAVSGRGETLASSASGSGDADVSSADFEIRQYDQAVADLKRVLDQNHKRLDPVTVQTVESNLAVIDDAIAQARRALLADPANPYLSGHLADQMKRKIRVLQQASDAVTADYSEGAS